MRHLVVVSAGVLCLFPRPALPAAPTISHREIGCVEAGRFPQFVARFTPAESVAAARLRFRAPDAPFWYDVAMTPSGSDFLALLPKPTSRLATFRYYISVVGRDLDEQRTAEYEPAVVTGPAGCPQNRTLAVSLADASGVVVSRPAGVKNAAMVPSGFSSDGIIAGEPTSAASVAAPPPPSPPSTTTGGEATIRGPSSSSRLGASLLVKAGTTGFGLELTKSVVPQLNVRLGYNTLYVTYDGAASDVDYAFEVQLRSAIAMLDWHPGGRAFRFSAGVARNRPTVAGSGRSTGTLTIGAHDYTRTEVGDLQLRVSPPKTYVPYAGIGAGNGGRGRLVFLSLDLGVLFQGRPRASLTANGTAAGTPQFQADLAQEMSELDEDLSPLRFYPQVTLGIGFRF